MIWSIVAKRGMHRQKRHLKPSSLMTLFKRAFPLRLIGKASKRSRGNALLLL
jgi:hypothetical protein